MTIINKVFNLLMSGENENANKDSRVLNVQRDIIAGIVSKHWFADHYPSCIVESNYVHVHDTDYLIQDYTNCCLLDLADCLDNGTVVNGVKIGTPNSLKVAATITTQLIATVASQQYGGVSVHGVDTILAKYATKSFLKHYHFAETVIGLEPVNAYHYADKQTEIEIKDSIQSLTYQINTLALANGQQPFITLGFGADQSRWANEISKTILRDRISGIGVDGTTPTFPKLVYHVKAGVNLHEGDPLYSTTLLAAECTSKRIYPDIISDDACVAQYGYTYTPMGCRSVPLQHKGTIAGSLNLGVVTLNLPAVAQAAAGCLDPVVAFKHHLKKAINLAFLAHNVRLLRLSKVKAKTAPLLWQHGGLGLRLQPDDLIFPHLIGRATLSLGYIGMADVCATLFPDNDYYDNKQFVISVLEALNEAADEFTAKNDIKMSVYGTPAESLCGKWSDTYHTNSYHTPAKQKVNPFDRFTFESSFPQFSSGGHIVYAELGDIRNNLPALLTLWRHGVELGIPYFAVNTSADTCLSCGYTGNIDLKDTIACPCCGESNPTKLSVLRRVSGYITTVANDKINQSKLLEMKDRVINSV